MCDGCEKDKALASWIKGVQLRGECSFHEKNNVIIFYHLEEQQ